MTKRNEGILLIAAVNKLLKPGCAEPIVIEAFNAMMNEYITLKTNAN